MCFYRLKVDIKLQFRVPEHNYILQANYTMQFYSGMLVEGFDQHIWDVYLFLIIVQTLQELLVVQNERLYIERIQHEVFMQEKDYVTGSASETVTHAGFSNTCRNVNITTRL